MLNLYFKTLPNGVKSSDVIIHNDAYFNQVSWLKMNVQSALVRDIIQTVDNVMCVDNKTFQSKFYDGKVLYSELSTGCKTALNTVLNPDKVVSVVECGSNAISAIIQAGIGNIYMPFICPISYFTQPIHCISVSKNMVVNSPAALSEFLEVNL